MFEVALFSDVLALLLLLLLIVDEAAKVVGFGMAVGLGILMPLAAAILRSSFSSRFRSFSLRLSTSSLGFRRILACMSLKRALWWCA